MKAKDKAIWLCTRPTAFNGSKWSHETTEIEVRIMAIVDGYAMIRRKGCIPFVCSVKELKENC